MAIFAQQGSPRGSVAYGLYSNTNPNLNSNPSPNPNTNPNPNNNPRLSWWVIAAAASGTRFAINSDDNIHLYSRANQHEKKQKNRQNRNLTKR